MYAIFGKKFNGHNTANNAYKINDQINIRKLIILIIKERDIIKSRFDKVFIKEMSDKLKIRKNEIIIFKTNRYEFSKDIQLMRKKINLYY